MLLKSRPCSPMCDISAARLIMDGLPDRKRVRYLPRFFWEVHHEKSCFASGVLPGKLARKLLKRAQKQKTASGAIFCAKDGTPLTRFQKVAENFKGLDR